MNRISILSAAILATLSATNVVAEESSRWSGEFIFATGYMSSNSNLNTEGDAIYKDINQKGTQEEEYFVAPLGNVAYSFGEGLNQRVYMGTSRDDLAVGDLAFEIGYQLDMQNGTQLDISFLPTVVAGEVWQDPYYEGKRRKTDVEGNAFRMQLHHIAGTGFSAEMAFGTQEVDEERIIHDDLLRDSDMFSLKASYLWPLSASSGLKTTVGFFHNDAEGIAQTYDQYELEATYFMHTGSYMLALTASYASREYDGTHPIFNEERKDDKSRLFVAYEYANFMGLENWDFVSFAGVDVTDSNINFYKSEDYVASIGLSYKF
ncbi:DUF2860 family protein [Shewanella maritima]|uniref:DUF2860 family protein n=1 Tax=Shewanella maritima TaxID=2520507 RepID=UPI0037353E8D